MSKLKMPKGWRPSYIPDFGVSAPPGGEGGGPGGRRDEQHDAPQHVGHQGQKEVRQLEVLQLVQIPIPNPNLSPKTKMGKSKFGLGLKVKTRK